MNAHQSNRTLPLRSIGFGVWLFCLLLFLAVHWYPIRFGALRFLLLADALLLWSGALWLLWCHKIIGRIFAVASLLFIAFLLLPSRTPNPQMLRQNYVRVLKNYEGTTYIWGGESKRGIDCSGLVRCALIDANIRQGLRNANPAALRAGFSLWWNDSSAKAMGEEYQGKTRFLFAAPSLNEMDYSQILPGDIAVTTSGVHVLAFVGNRTWIEADPNELHGNRVIQVKVPTRNAWFNMPVNIMRWRQLEK